MEGRLLDFERATSTQVVVVIIPSLDGQAIEDLAARTIERWGVGQKERNNGVLLLVAVGDRRARIEVGYGLEDRLTDALSRRILEDRLFPALRRGDFASGIAATCDGIIDATRGAYVALPPKKKRVPVLAALVPIAIIVLLLWIGAQGGGGLSRRGRRRFIRSGPIWWSGGGWGSGGGGSGWGGGSGGGGGFGGFSGGGGMSGGGGASGSW